MKTWISALCALAFTTGCGPEVRGDASSDGSQGSGDTQVGSETQPPGSSTGVFDSSSSSDTSSSGSESSGTDGSPKVWGRPELVAALEAPGMLYPESIAVRDPWIFASSGSAGMSWRIDARDLEVVSASGGGFRLFATDEYVYAEGRGPCCGRFGFEPFEGTTVEGAGAVVGANGDGVAFFRFSSNFPEPDTMILAWLEDGADASSDVYESADLAATFGVNSTDLVVALGSDLVAIETGSWTETVIVPDAQGLMSSSGSAVTDEHVYLAEEERIRVIELATGTEVSIEAAPVQGSVVAGVGRVAWIDGADARRIWAATADGTAAEEVIAIEESGTIVSDLVLATDALYWMQSFGEVYRLAYPP